MTTEHASKSTRAITGLFAVLGGFFPSRGCGAPSPDVIGASKIRLLVSLAVTAAFFALTGTALAAPEPPTLELASKTSTEATLKGTVTSTVVSEGDTYELLYKKSATECTGGGHSAGGSVAAEEILETLKGLQPEATYTVCLLLENGAHEKAESPPVTFTLPPEAPLTEPATEATATTAVLHGVLNPIAKAKTGWYFDYSTEMSCESGLRTPQYPEEEVQGESVAQKVVRLEPSKTYTFCLVASVEAPLASDAFESTPSSIGQSFTTGALPPAVINEASSGVEATEATLEATLNPNNQETTYSFEYSTSSTLAGATTLAGGSFPVDEFGERGVSVPTGAVLAPHTTYYYRVIAENTKGEKAVPGKIQSFTTYTPPQTPQTTNPAKSITGTTAVLEGTLNPGAKAKEGWYFAYNEGPSCAGGSTTGFEAEVEAQALPVKAEVTNLQPNKHYTFCLVAANRAEPSESAQGNEVHLSTLVLAPAISGESATGIKATEAMLHASINPNNQETSYTFEYATNEALTGATKLAGGPLTGFGEQSVSVPVSGLAQHQTYYYRVLAENAKGEKAVPGKVERFITGPLEAPEKLEANPIAATTATLNGVLSPEHAIDPGAYEFLYDQSATACEGGQTSTGNALGSVQEGVKAEVTGLLPNTTYSFCLRADHEAEVVTSAPVRFRTLPDAFATATASTSITLHAVLNPEGSATSYHFEYGTSTEYGSQTPEASAGAGTGPISVEAQVQNLTAASLYHFRVVATNAANETFESEDETFTTQSTDTEFTLPDNRAYEMVTPVQKSGALFSAGGAIRAAASGDAIADVANEPIENQPDGNADPTVAVLSTRGPSGWSSRTISAPHPSTGPERENNEEYLSFSEDLSRAVVEPIDPGPGFEKLSPLATEVTPYLHTLFSGGNVAEPCLAPYTSAQSCYAPLVSASNDTASPFQPFGEYSPDDLCTVHYAICGPRFTAGTPDLNQLVFTSSVALTATPVPTRTAHEVLPDLYEYSAGRLQLLSILPGQTEGSANLRLAGREGINESEVEKGAVAARHAISDDGSRVIIDQLEAKPNGASVQRTGLYLRDLIKSETIRLDLTETGAPPGPYGEPEYMDASGEGSRIFFLDGERLTANSGATNGGEAFKPQDQRPDLYECAITEVDGKDHCALTDLTPETNHESAHVATVLGASEDDSYVYFAAAGDLGLAPPESEPGGCEQVGGEEDIPATALCNVFVRHDGVTKFVAALSQADRGDWVTNGSPPSAVRVSPNGSYLAFLSDRPLTGYDSRPQVPGNCKQATLKGVKLTSACSEAYLYHAPADLQTEAGTLSCASCDPTGSRPAGPAGVPGWPDTFEVGGQLEAYDQPRYLTDEGRLFFNSPDPLVPLDVSKQSEVYEYEPQGTGTCTESTSSGSELYVPQEHGCVALISTGTAAEGSQFLEASAGAGEGEAGEAASAGGRDVFFLTSEKVLPQDIDTVPDVYDAHECTAASPCIAPPSALRPCETEASCKAPPTPQPTIYAAPSSATFVGPGNQATPPPPAPAKVTKKAAKCKKGFVKNKKNKCVKKSKKKHTKAKKSSRATTNRRTHS
jgi:hypothetical protein